MYIGQEITNKIQKDNDKMIDVLIEDKFDLVSDIKSFDDSDIELTLGDYIDDMIKPMESFKVYDVITDQLDGTDYDDIKIITADSASDQEKFNRVFNELATKKCRDIGDYSIVDLGDLRVAYSYQEGGYPVLLVRI